VDAIADALSKNLLPSLDQTTDKTKSAASGVNLLQSALEARGLINASNTAHLQLSQLGDILDEMSSRQWFDGPILSDVPATITQLSKQLGILAGSDLPSAQAQFRRLAEDAGLSKAQQIQLIQAMPEYRDAILRSGEAVGAATDEQKLLNGAVGATPAIVEEAAASVDIMAAAASNADDNLTEMKDALSSVNDAATTMSGSLDDALGSLNDMAKAADAEDVSIDGLNDTSIAFRDSIRDVEQAHKDAAEAILNNGGTLDEAKGKYYQGRDAVIEMLKAKGLDQKAAEDWADKNLGSASDVENALRNVSTAVDQIPAKKVITLVADTSPAMATINSFIFDNNNRRINFYVDGYVGRQVNGVDMVARAGGGIIPGAPSNRDNMIAAVATGEFVVRASQVVHPENRRVLEYINAGGRMRGYAMGGFVQPHYASTSGSGYAGAPSFEVHVHAAPGMDEGALVNKAVRKVQELMK
jgi:hypothetical protein